MAVKKPTFFNIYNTEAQEPKVLFISLILRLTDFHNDRLVLQLKTACNTNNNCIIIVTIIIIIILSNF